MGRLPTQYAGEMISFRIPYSMFGELVVDPDINGEAFPDSVFQHNIERPFEIHRLRIEVIAIDDAGVPVDPQPALMAERVRLNIVDTSKDVLMTKAATRVEDLITSNARTWEWEQPYTIVRSEGFNVDVSTDSLIADTFFRVQLNFQGFQIVIAPPSEVR